ncbi:MAG: GldG family protein [Mariprofundales bacterium]|nr:GldG family protein [Mariprofundales bacterium]
MNAAKPDRDLFDGRKVIRRRAWLMLSLVLIATVAVYAAAWTAHLRWDWTENQIYSLSHSTRSVLKQIKDPVHIRAYITRGLPQPYGSLRRFIGDMLASYHDAAPNTVSYQILDPSSDPNVAASLAAMNIPRVQVQSIEDDQARIKQGYMAIVVDYLDKKVTIPVVQSETGFEYNLTSKIKRITGNGRATIGVVGAFGASGLDQLRRLRELAGDDYQLTAIHPEKRPIDKRITAVVIAGMRKPPSPQFRYRLDQFRMQGKGILVLAGNAVPQLQVGFEVQPVDPYTNDWLTSDLGVVVKPGLVLDRDASRVVVNRRQGRFMFRSVVDYPFMPAVRDLNEQQVVTRGLKLLAMPFVSPLGCVDDNKCTTLMRSSAQSAAQNGPPFDVNPMRDIASRFAGIQQSAQLLGVVLSGAAKSAFSAPPVGIGIDTAKSKPITQTDNQRVMVLGAPALLDDDFLDGDNTLFVLNALDWLSGNSDLIDLRSRGVSERPLDKIDSQARAMWKGIWMFGLPLLVTLLALWRWRRRAVPPVAR